MRRVVIFHPSMSHGGMDRVLVTLLRHLDRNRFAPTLLLLRREGELLGEVPNDVPIAALDVPRLAVAGPGLVAFLRRHHPDVVFLTSAGVNIVGTIAHRAARIRARLVLSERTVLHRDDRTRARQIIEMRLKKLTYPRADLITAVSRGVASEIVAELGVPSDRVRVVYNPVVGDDLRERSAEPVAHPWFNESVPIILSVGRLVDIKDYPTLLEAFARVRMSAPARLVVLGTGPLREALEHKAHALGVAEHVAFLGFDPNPYKYLARARLLLHASRAEGLPGVQIQSLACGTPVVSTDCDYGPREVIQGPGYGGFLVPIGDVTALADRALAILSDEQLRRRLSDDARRAADRFRIAAAMGDYEAALAG